MSNMPHFLQRFLIRIIGKQQAKEVWDWLNSNSNTVITDELEIAIRKRRDWTDKDEK